MDNPRPEKVAVVDEVKQRLEGADAAVLTDYRGIDVAAMAQLRRSLTEAGGDFKIFKNTLVRFAVRDLGIDVEELLVGPTAIAFVPKGDDGTPGDPVAVAKALDEFAKGNEHLIVKGGLLGEQVLTADEVKALAKVAPREELLARLAGGLAAPLQQMAGLLNALPQQFAYALQALVAAGGAPGAPADAPAEEAPADEAPEEAAPAEDAAADEPEAATDDAEASTDTDTETETEASTDAEAEQTDETNDGEDG